jgi:hypothetical protein
MLGFGRTVLPTDYVKVWAHGFAQQEGRTKAREYLLSWWCSSPAKVASGEVGQQRRSRGRVAAEGGRRAGTGRENAEPQVALDLA